MRIAIPGVVCVYSFQIAFAVTNHSVLRRQCFARGKRYGAVVAAAIHGELPDSGTNAVADLIKEQFFPVVCYPPRAAAGGWLQKKAGISIPYRGDRSFCHAGFEGAIESRGHEQEIG